MKKLSFTPAGVCSTRITLELEDDRITRLEFTGGCPGNAIGLAKLAVGKTPAEVVALLTGIRCGKKTTSCPDQLARALADFLKKDR